MRSFYLSSKLVFLFLMISQILNAQEGSEMTTELDQKVVAIRLASRPDRALFSEEGSVKDGYFTSRWKKQYWFFEKVGEGYYKIQNLVTKKHLSSTPVAGNISVVDHKSVPKENLFWEVVALKGGVLKLRSFKTKEFLTFADIKHTEAIAVANNNDLKQVLILESTEKFKQEKKGEFSKKASLVSVTR